MFAPKAPIGPRLSGVVSGEKRKLWRRARAMASAASDSRIGQVEPGREDRNELAQAWLRSMRAHERIRRLQAGEPLLRLVPKEPRADDDQ